MSSSFIIISYFSKIEFWTSYSFERAFLCRFLFAFLARIRKAKNLVIQSKTFLECSKSCPASAAWPDCQFSICLKSRPETTVIPVCTGQVKIVWRFFRKGLNMSSGAILNINFERILKIPYFEDCCTWLEIPTEVKKWIIFCKIDKNDIDTVIKIELRSCLFGIFCGDFR